MTEPVLDELRHGEHMARSWKDDFLPYAHDYFKETNQSFGLYGLTIGIACIGKDPAYAWVALFLLPLFWATRFSNYKKKLVMLKAVNHEIMRPYIIFKKCYFAFIGWAFAGLVALNVIK